MKRIFSIILVGAIVCGCADALEESPKSLSAEVFYNTADEANAAVMAIYGPMRGDNALGINYPAQLEGLPDYGNSRGSQTPVSLYQGLDNTNINRVGSIWDLFYQSIRNANLVIEYVPAGTETSDALKAAYVAEAKYMRALIYFAMIRNWGAVPLRTEENMTVADVPRTPVEQIYTLILSDLAAAEASLPDVTTQYGRATKWAAKTMLTEVLMYQNKWTESAAKAAEVINSGRYSLVPVAVSEDYQKIFGPDVVTTPEEIFYFKYSRQQGFGLVGYAHRATNDFKYYGPGGVYAQYTDSTSNSFIKTWDKKDLRKTHILYKMDVGLGPNTVLFRKFRDPQAASFGAGNDYPWYRYADLLLFHAEVAARAAGAPTAEAVESLNKVHRRAYGYSVTGVSPVDFVGANYTLDQFIDLVVRERGYETMYEGKRWNDLKRLGIAKARIKAVKNIDILDKHMNWPIPLSEMNYNRALLPTDQNPGY